MKRERMHINLLFPFAGITLFRFQGYILSHVIYVTPLKLSSKVKHKLAYSTKKIPASTYQYEFIFQE